MTQLTAILYAPWPWYIVGPLMGVTIPMLLFWGNRMLGASSSLRHLCTVIPTRIDYFQYNRQSTFWNVIFALGVLIGGAITYNYFYEAESVQLAATTEADLTALGLHDLSGLMPKDLFGSGHLWSARGMLFTVGGGFLVGFGVRYAGGCTSGHGFMGLSQLSLSSFIAILAFFAGGLFCTHFLLQFLI